MSSLFPQASLAMVAPLCILMFAAIVLTQSAACTHVVIWSMTYSSLRSASLRRLHSELATFMFYLGNHLLRFQKLPHDLQFVSFQSWYDMPCNEIDNPQS